MDKPGADKPPQPPPSGPSAPGGRPLPEGAEPEPRGTRAAALVRWFLVALLAALATSALLGRCPPRDALPPAVPGDVRETGEGAPDAAQGSPEAEQGDPDADGDARPPGQGAGGHAHGAPAGTGGSGAPPPGPAPGRLPGLAPVEISPERLQLGGIRLATAERGRIGRTIRASAYLTFDEDARVRVQPRFSGSITELKVSRTGEAVAEGQVLARAYSPDVLAAAQELLQARRWRGRQARELAAAARRRLALLGLAPEDIEAIERARRAPASVAVRAPAAGSVLSKPAVEGGFFAQGETLFEIAGLDTVWVIAQVYEQDLKDLSVGADARLEVSAYPGMSFRGKVDFLYPALDAQTRTAQVRLTLPNPGHHLLPGLFGELFIEAPPAEGVLVPRGAVVDTGDHRYLFVAGEGGRLEPREVRVGPSDEERSLILEGVSAGERVVASGNFLVDAESRLRSAIEGQAAAGEPGVGGAGESSDCDARIDRDKYPDKHRDCRACEVQHRGMGSMVEDCKNAIPRPWR